MTDYRRLEAWKSSQTLAVSIYRLTDRFPPRERFGLTAQMRRAAVSIMSNIAEGAGRGTDKQFTMFLRIARGSLHEVESQCLLAHELEFSSAESTNETLDDISPAGRLLHGLLRAVSQ